MNNKKNMVFKSFIIFLFCIFLLVNFNACYENKSVEKSEVKTEKSHKVVYTCPMHPQVKQDKPGSCPICKMDLVPIDDSKKDESSKKDLEKDSHKHTPEKNHEHTHEYSHEHSRLNYDKVNQDQIKTSSNFLSIRTSFAIPTFKAKYMEVSNTYEAVAYTELSEAFLYNIYFNMPVWIESTFGTFEGQLVKKGQKILKIRSLEIEETKKELEIARKYKDKKMEEFILKKLSILRQYSFGKLSSDGIVVSSSDFILVKKIVSDGEYVDKGKPVMVLSKPENLFIVAYIPFNEVKNISQKVVLVEDPFNKSFKKSTIKQISFYSDKQSKTVRYLIYLPSEFPKVVNLPLKVKFEDYKNCLVVPYESVVNTGNKMIVYKKLKDDEFLPVEVQIGSIWENEGYKYYEVKSGLTEGEEIAQYGYFLIDSEARIRNIY